MVGSPAYALIAISNLSRAAFFRQVVDEALELETVVVRDGDEATAEIGRKGAPRLLIVDLSLPRVDGFAVVRKLRRQGAEADSRVIVVSAHESLRAAARELAAPLAISAVLPLDTDAASLADVLAAETRAPHRANDVFAPATTSLAQQSSDLDDVIDRGAVEARRRFRMPASIGYLRVDEDEHLTFHVSAREPGPAIAIGDVTEFRFLRQVADTTDPLIIPSVDIHPVFSQLLLKGPRPPRGFAAVPIASSRNNIRAALCILDTKPLALSASDVDELAALARQVGQELDRVVTTGKEPKANSSRDAGTAVDAEEMKALQHLAATDPLTGLANRRGGERHISTEISRAKRERRPMSCVLIDLDRFKQVNDTFGHQAGDQLLRDVSNLLRRTIRAYDILVRWGGEEFLLVLPGVDRDVARMLAERVRIAVEALDTHGIGPVTLSAGVAGFENDYDFTATLKTADRRLYQAKAGGRNCVV
jgi:diguanylate cyclase (GGDEF)-like protein